MLNYLQTLVCAPASLGVSLSLSIKPLSKILSCRQRQTDKNILILLVLIDIMTPHTVSKIKKEMPLYDCPFIYYRHIGHN